MPSARTFIIKETAAQLFSNEFCRVFKKISLLEYSWKSASDFIFDMFKLNKCMKVSFLFTFFNRKSKPKQESRVALKLGNLRFVLQ